MARKKASTTSKAAPAPAPETVAPRAADTAPALPALPRSRFTLYNLLGKERAHYLVDRAELERPPEPKGAKTVAHSIFIIDRSGSMYGCIEDVKDTLVKLLTLEEYGNFNLLVSLITFSGSGDVTVHFQRSPIQEIMKRGIIAGLFTEEQAQHHLRLIREHLLFPDGVRLMDRPTAYRGGPERVFRRAEDGNWQSRQNGQWRSEGRQPTALANEPAARQMNRQETRTTEARSTDIRATSPGTPRPRSDVRVSTPASSEPRAGRSINAGYV